MEPSSGGEQLILAKVYIWFNGASPYSQCCGGIWPPVDGSMCVPKHVVVNFTWAFNVFLINIVLWVHELVIIETGIHHHSTLNTIKNYTHIHKLKTIIRILFNKQFYQDILLACKQQTSFYIFHDMHFCSLNCPLFQNNKDQVSHKYNFPLDDGHEEVRNV